MNGDEIALLFLHAKSVKNPLFIMKYQVKPKKTGSILKTLPSFAVAPSKKVFKTAVLRNKIRRRIYGAIVSAEVGKLPYLIVFIPNLEALNAPYKALVEAINYSCKDLIKS